MDTTTQEDESATQIRSEVEAKAAAMQGRSFAMLLGSGLGTSIWMIFCVLCKKMRLSRQ